MRTRIVIATLAALIVALPARAGNYTDWWWGGSAQSGHGVNVGQQANMVFVSWFTYDETGNGMWVVLSGPLDSFGRVVTGKFFRTTGPALGTTFDPLKVVPTEVGAGTLTFTDMHHATFDWTVNGKSGTLALVRQTYGASTIDGDYEGTTDGNLHCMGMGPYPYPTDMAIHGSARLSITVAGTQVSGTERVGSSTCIWTGTAAQSGQTVRIQGSTSCPAPLGTASLDVTLFMLDRALVGWLKASSSAMGCTQTEQFAMVQAD